MGTFGAISTFRVGYWKGIRGFLLGERRDVIRRIAVIDAELARIGKVHVQYKKTEVDGEVRATEERTAMFVDAGTSLERLMQAYIAQGGNPFDISHFFMPDETMAVGQDSAGNTILADAFPYGGVAAPQNAEYNEPLTYDGYKGGYLPMHKYPPNRTGDRTDRSSAAEPVTALMIEARRWVGQEISEKLHNLEARIIKLCDLREQLEKEKELLKAMHGGTLSSLPETYHQPGGMYANALRLQNIVGQMDAIFFVTNDEGAVTQWSPAGGQLSPYHGIFWEDHPAEKTLTMMA